jgi:hypothetical protein
VERARGQQEDPRDEGRPADARGVKSPDDADALFWPARSKGSGRKPRRAQKKTEKKTAVRRHDRGCGQKFMAVMESLVTPQNSVWHC